MKFIAALVIGMTAAQQVNLDVDAPAISEVAKAPSALTVEEYSNESDDGESSDGETTSSATNTQV